MCPDVLNQIMNSNQFKFNLIKNEAFYYVISDPDIINSSKNKSEVKKNDDGGNKNYVNNSKIENINDNDIEIDMNNGSSQISNSESKNVKINNDQEKTYLKRNNNKNYYDSESEFLEKNL